MFFLVDYDFEYTYTNVVHNRNNARHVAFNEQFNAHIIFKWLTDWLQFNDMNDYCHFSYHIHLDLSLSSPTNSTTIVSVYYLLLPDSVLQQCNRVFGGKSMLGLGAFVGFNRI